MKKIAFYTLGCKLNFAETSFIADDLKNKGYELVSFNDIADFYVINTCTVTLEAEKKFIKLAGQAKRKNSQAKIIAIGCFAELGDEKIEREVGACLILGTNQKFDLYKYIENTDFDFDKNSYHSSFNEKNYFQHAFSLNDRTRSFLKIQDGCDYFCSYCTVPLARGGSRSDTVENILKNIREIIESGVKEIVLTGVNIGDFSSPGGYRLIDLLRMIEEINGPERITLSSIEPDLLTGEIINAVAQSKKILPHLHIPMQSGSNKILQLMRRKYDDNLFIDRINNIHSLMPHAFIGIDVIVGFPGEDNEDFLQTFNLLENTEVSYLHVFPFSWRPNTRAALMEGKLHENIITRRVKKLLELSDVKKKLFYGKFIGTERKVLFEKKIKNGFIFGLTDNYIRIKVPADISLINQIRDVKLISADNDNVVVGEINE